MCIRARFIAGLAGAGAAVALMAAPIAAATPSLSEGLECSAQGGNTLCVSPGNAQLTATPPVVQYQPQYPYFLGGLGFHHGGHH
jgi:hypothetical protein